MKYSNYNKRREKKIKGRFVRMELLLLNTEQNIIYDVFNKGNGQWINNGSANRNWKGLLLRKWGRKAKEYFEKIFQLINNFLFVGMATRLLG